jgi:hypothetical protein
MSWTQWCSRAIARALAVGALVAGLAVSGLALSPVREAAAQTKPTKEAMEEARTRYERGTELYNDGAYEQALLEFERAYELAPAYRILFNIAQVAVLLRDYPKAIRAYQQFLKDGGQRIPAERRKTVETELGSLQGRVAHITIKVNVEDAEILVDDLVVGRSPLTDPVMVNAGRHSVAARKRGLNQDSETVVLAGTDKVDVELELVEPTAPTAPVPLPQPDKPDERPVEAEKDSYVWVGWVVTATLTAGAVATGIATFYSTRKLGDMRETAGTTRAELDDQQSTARALGITADVLIASAIVAGGVTLYFTIDELVDGDSEAKIEAGVMPNGIAVRGRF